MTPRWRQKAGVPIESSAGPAFGASGPPPVQMVAHGVGEFYVDFSLRCSTRMLDATCEAGGYRYASYAVLYQIAGLGARLAASLVAPLLLA